MHFGMLSVTSTIPVTATSIQPEITLTKSQGKGMGSTVVGIPVRYSYYKTP